MAARHNAIDRLLRDLDDFRAQLEALRTAPVDDDPELGLKEIWARYKVGRAGILAAETRGELKVIRKTGRKAIKVRQSALDAWDTSGSGVGHDDGDEERARQLRAWAGGGHG